MKVLSLIGSVTFGKKLSPSPLLSHFLVAAIAAAIAVVVAPATVTAIAAVSAAATGTTLGLGFIDDQGAALIFLTVYG